MNGSPSAPGDRRTVRTRDAGDRGAPPLPTTRERPPPVSTSDLFELRVLVEATDWHDVATLMSDVERAIDPHHVRAGEDRRWSVVANRLSAQQAAELRTFLDERARAAPG